MHRQNRARFLEILAREDAAAVIPCGHPPIRNHDCEYRFRPHSDFYYLTGFDEPECVLVLVGGKEPRTVLFLRERNRDEEVWTGRRLGVEAAPETLGVDEAHPVQDLWKELPELLGGRSRVVYRMGDDEDRDRRMIQTAGGMRAKVRAGVTAPVEWIDPSLWLHEERLVKSAEELAGMRRAVEITTEAHLAAMCEAAPGVNESEIDALLEYTFRRRGSTGPAYTNIVAGGANACILHYIQNDQPLSDGDLLLIDAGAEWKYYASDVTRTFPVNGRFNAEQRALYDVVLDAQKTAIQLARPGSTSAKVHETAVDHLCRGLIELGLLKGTLEEVVEKEAYKRFYMHRTGHWLGLDVHDCGAYHLDGVPRKLEPGMVLTVEPGLYVAPDDETVDERWRGIGIRIEDDILVTPSGNEVLTAAIPKEVEAVEAACQANLQPA